MLSIQFYRKFGIYGGGIFFMIMGMEQPFFSLYAQQLGASTAAIGLLVTLQSLLPIFIAMPTGQIIDSIGPIRMMKYGSLLLILSLLIFVMATNLWMLSISQILIGACLIIMPSSFQVLVSSGTKNERNDNIKKYSMWISAGAMVGPLIGGVLTSFFINELFGYRTLFSVACLVSILFFIVLLFVSRGYKFNDKVHVLNSNNNGILRSYGSIVQLTKFQSVQFGLIATFIIMFIQAMYRSFMPIYLKEIGYSILLVSVVISLKEMAAMLSRLGLGWIMKRTHLERILIVAGFIASVCVMIIPIAGLHSVSIILVTLLIGGTTGINLPISIMVMVNDTKESDRGKVMGLRLIVNRFSQILSPATFGILGQKLGLSIAFFTGGTFLIFTMLGFSIYSSKKIKLKTYSLESKEKKNNL